MKKKPFNIEDYMDPEHPHRMIPRCDKRPRLHGVLIKRLREVSTKDMIKKKTKEK